MLKSESESKLAINALCAINALVFDIIQSFKNCFSCYHPFTCVINYYIKYVYNVCNNV